MKEMLKTHKKPLIGGLLLIILLLGYFTRDKWMEWLKIGDVTKNYTGSNSSSKPSSSSNTIDKTKVLKQGDKGASVKELQRLLNLEHDYQKANGTVPIEPKLVTDGIFGPKTQAMLLLFAGKNTSSINDLIQVLKDKKSSNA